MFEIFTTEELKEIEEICVEMQRIIDESLDLIEWSNQMIAEMKEAIEEGQKILDTL